MGDTWVSFMIGGPARTSAPLSRCRFGALAIHCNSAVEEGALALSCHLPGDRALGALCAGKPFSAFSIMKLRVPQVARLNRCFSLSPARNVLEHTSLHIPGWLCCGCRSWEAPRRGPREGLSSKNRWGWGCIMRGFPKSTDVGCIAEAILMSFTHPYAR